MLDILLLRLEQVLIGLRVSERLSTPAVCLRKVNWLAFGVGCIRNLKARENLKGEYTFLKFGFTCPNLGLLNHVTFGANLIG